MYERSAVILEKYFSEKFLYTKSSNLKDNFLNYCDLVEKFEKYQNVSDEEDKIIKECEEIIDKIKEVQKRQNILNQDIIKLHQERSIIFENIDESSENIKKALEDIEFKIEQNILETNEVDKLYIEIIALFEEKSKVRKKWGRERRKVEKVYREILDLVTKNYDNMNQEEFKKLKLYALNQEKSINEELKEKMLKNGEKEKIPFDLDVIESSILLGENIHKEEFKLLLDAYSKTGNLLNQINNGDVNVERYKRLARNINIKLEFLNVKKEYLFLFLDNERLTVSLGKKEHTKLMEEACLDLKQDLRQIDNLNELLLKEMAGKPSKKAYRELYNEKYLKDLQRKEIEFDEKAKELNLIGKIINPIYWRIDGIEKIYDVFEAIVTQEYERDLSEFKEELEEFLEEDILETVKENIDVPNDNILMIKDIEEAEDDYEEDDKIELKNELEKIDEKQEKIENINKDKESIESEEVDEVMLPMPELNEIDNEERLKKDNIELILQYRESFLNSIDKREVKKEENKKSEEIIEKEAEEKEEEKDDFEENFKKYIEIDEQNNNYDDEDYIEYDVYQDIKSLLRKRNERIKENQTITIDVVNKQKNKGKKSFLGKRKHKK